MPPPYGQTENEDDFVVARRNQPDIAAEASRLSENLRNSAGNYSLVNRLIFCYVYTKSAMSHRQWKNDFEKSIRRA
jgi:hypothetical protein